MSWRHGAVGVDLIGPSMGCWQRGKLTVCCAVGSDVCCFMLHTASASVCCMLHVAWPMPDLAPCMLYIAHGALHADDPCCALHVVLWCVSVPLHVALCTVSVALLYHCRQPG